MSQTPDQSLKDALKRLHETGDYADMSIVCGNKTYKAHKAVVCPRSKYFKVMFKNAMQESRTSQVDLSEHNPEAVKHLVDFFYLLDYTPTHPAPDLVDEPEPDLEPKLEEAIPDATGSFEAPADDMLIPTSKKKKMKKLKKGHREPAKSLPSSLAHDLQSETFLLENCQVYALAEYCQVNELKILAASKFRTEAEKHWNHPDFFEAIQEVYRTSVPKDRLLRDIVVDVIHEHKELLGRHEYRKIVSQLDLSFELLMAVHQHDGWTRRFM